MEKMGFNEHWIRLMMLCAKTVTFHIEEWGTQRHDHSNKRH